MSYEPPPIQLPPPDPRSVDELRDIIEQQDTELRELQALASFWEKKARVAEESGMYTGYLLGRASKIRDTQRWGGDGLTIDGF